MKINIVSLCLFTIFFTSYSMLDSDFEPEFVEDEFDQMAEQITWETNRVDCISVFSLVSILTDPESPFILQERLQDNLYKYTNPPHQRSLLDYSWTLLHQWCLPDHWQLGLTLFYNQNSKANFTQEGTTLDAYLNFNNGNLLQQLESLNFLGIDLTTAIELIRPFKLQERRTGLMIGGYRRKGNWIIDVKGPLYYLERNLFLTESEKTALENFFKNVSFSDDDNPTDYSLKDIDDLQSDDVNKHFMNDKVGLGDIRLYIGHVMRDTPNVFVVIGGGLTLPTALTFVDGLMGGNFVKNNQYPPFNFFDISQLVTCMPRQIDKAQEIGTEFLIGVVEKLSANLVDTSLGNDGHLGLNLFTDFSIDLGNYLTVKSHIELEGFLPAHEKRFYLIAKDPAEFNRDYEDPDLAQANLDFLNQQFINTLIPYMVNTLIWPGFIVKYSSALSVPLWGNNQANIGYDVWWQSSEHLGTVNVAGRPPLRTDIAKLHEAFQAKIFGSINYSQQASWFDWCLSLYGDKTIFNTAIGKDFTITVHFSMNV